MRKVIKTILTIILILLVICLVFLIITDKKRIKPIKKKIEVVLTKEDKINKMISEMSIDEKINQLLYVQINSDDWINYKSVKYGGVIIGSKSSYVDLELIGKDYKIGPFIGTDDEGGLIERAAKGYKNARDYKEDIDLIYSDEVKKSKELLSKNINMNLGPVTDTITSSNSPLYYRSYSSDRDKVKNCINAIIKARTDTVINNKRIGSVLKHYPGYPEISINTDYGEALDNTSVDEINKNISVFNSGIDSGAIGVMVSNVIYNKIDKDNPASLSSKIVSPLRDKFEGIIMTDDIGVAKGLINIEDRYIKALVAGNDMIVIWDINVDEAIKNIKENVGQSITEEDIDKKLHRIINTKYDLGLIGE